MADRCVLRDHAGLVRVASWPVAAYAAYEKLWTSIGCHCTPVRLGRARGALWLLSISLDALVEQSRLPISSSIPLGIERAPAAPAPAVVAAESALVAFWVRTFLPSIQSGTTTITLIDQFVRHTRLPPPSLSRALSLTAYHSCPTTTTTTMLFPFILPVLPILLEWIGFTAITLSMMGNIMGPPLPSLPAVSLLCLNHALHR
jgi:hypothetical protein